MLIAKISKNIKMMYSEKSRYRNGKDFLNLKTALVFNKIHPVLLRIPGGFSHFLQFIIMLKIIAKVVKYEKVIHRQYQMDHSCACGFVSCYLYVQWN